MPLAEIVFCYPDGEEITVFTDKPPVVGERLRVGSESWEVYLERKPTTITSTARFLCRLTREQRSRAVEMREQEASRRERIMARWLARQSART